MASAYPYESVMREWGNGTRVARYKLLEGDHRVGWKLVLGIEGGVRGNSYIAYRFTRTFP